MSAKYYAVREMKWALDRLVNELNAENPHLAACAVWDIAGTLVITLLQAKNPNPHIPKLAQFLHEKWR
jgi:hypothetical protein